MKKVSFSVNDEDYEKAVLIAEHKGLKSDHSNGVSLFGRLSFKALINKNKKILIDE